MNALKSVARTQRVKEDTIRVITLISQCETSVILSITVLMTKMTCPPSFVPSSFYNNIYKSAKLKYFYVMRKRTE